MTDATILPFRPRADAPVQQFPSPAGPAGGERVAGEPVAAGLRAAREADQRIEDIASMLFGQRPPTKDAEEAVRHELRALSAMWEKAASDIRDLARRTYALNQARAANTAFEMARLCEDCAAEVYPPEPEQSA